jgi:hypothetical protein
MTNLTTSGLNLLVKDSSCQFYSCLSNHLLSDKSSNFPLVIFWRLEKPSNIHTANIRTFTVYDNYNVSHCKINIVTVNTVTYPFPNATVKYLDNII